MLRALFEVSLSESSMLEENLYFFIVSFLEKIRKIPSEKKNYSFNRVLSLYYIIISIIVLLLLLYYRVVL